MAYRWTSHGAFHGRLGLSRLRLQRPCDPPLHDADDWSCATAPSASITARVIARRTRSSLIRTGASCSPAITCSPISRRTRSSAVPWDPESAERPHALLEYIESMRATRELSLKLILSGHGDPFADHVGLIDERLRCTSAGPASCWRMLAPAPLTA